MTTATTVLAHVLLSLDLGTGGKVQATMARGQKETAEAPEVSAVM